LGQDFTHPSRATLGPILWVPGTNRVFTGFYRVLPGFTVIYRFLPGFTGFLPGFYWLFTGFLQGFTGIYRFLPGFTEFLRGFTGIYLFLPLLPGF